MSTNKHEQGLHLVLFENGDDSTGRFYNLRPGLKLWDNFLLDITDALRPKFGCAKYVFTDTGRQVTSFSDLKPGGKYVISDKQCFKPLTHGYRTQNERSVPRRPSIVHYPPTNDVTTDSADDAPASPGLHSNQAYGQQSRNRNTIVHLFRNGTAGVPARKMVFRPHELLQCWDRTLVYIARALDIPAGGICSLYTVNGKEIRGPWQLQNGACYVAVGFHDHFKAVDYMKYYVQNAETFKNMKIDEPFGVKTRNACILQTTCERKRSRSRPNSAKSGKSTTSTKTTPSKSKQSKGSKQKDETKTVEKPTITEELLDKALNEVQHKEHEQLIEVIEVDVNEHPRIEICPKACAEVEIGPEYRRKCHCRKKTPGKGAGQSNCNKITIKNVACETPQSLDIPRSHRNCVCKTGEKLTKDDYTKKLQSMSCPDQNQQQVLRSEETQPEEENVYFGHRDIDLTECPEDLNKDLLPPKRNVQNVCADNDNVPDMMMMKQRQNYCDDLQQICRDVERPILPQKRSQVENCLESRQRYLTQNKSQHFASDDSCRDRCRQNEDIRRQNQDRCKQNEDIRRQHEDRCVQNQDRCIQNEDIRRQNEVNHDRCKHIEDRIKQNTDRCRQEQERWKSNQNYDRCKQANDLSRQSDERSKQNDDRCRQEMERWKSNENYERCRRVNDLSRQSDERSHQNDDRCKQEMERWKSNQNYERCKQANDFSRQSDERSIQNEDRCRQEQERWKSDQNYERCRRINDLSRQSDDRSIQNVARCRKELERWKSTESYDRCKQDNEDIKRPNEDRCKQEQERWKSDQNYERCRRVNDLNRQSEDRCRQNNERSIQNEHRNIFMDNQRTHSKNDECNSPRQQECEEMKPVQQKCSRSNSQQRRNSQNLENTESHNGRYAAGGLLCHSDSSGRCRYFVPKEDILTYIKSCPDNIRNSDIRETSNSGIRSPRRRGSLDRGSNQRPITKCSSLGRNVPQHMSASEFQEAIMKHVLSIDNTNTVPHDRADSCRYDKNLNVCFRPVPKESKNISDAETDEDNAETKKKKGGKKKRSKSKIVNKCVTKKKIVRKKGKPINIKNIGRKSSGESDAESVKSAKSKCCIKILGSTTNTCRRPTVNVEGNKINIAMPKTEGVPCIGEHLGNEWCYTFCTTESDKRNITTLKIQEQLLQVQEDDLGLHETQTSVAAASIGCCKICEKYQKNNEESVNQAERPYCDKYPCCLITTAPVKLCPCCKGCFNEADDIIMDEENDTNFDTNDVGVNHRKVSYDEGTNFETYDVRNGNGFEQDVKKIAIRNINGDSKALKAKLDMIQEQSSEASTSVASKNGFETRTVGTNYEPPVVAEDNTKMMVEGQTIESENKCICPDLLKPNEISSNNEGKETEKTLCFCTKKPVVCECIGSHNKNAGDATMKDTNKKPKIKKKKAIVNGGVKKVKCDKKKVVKKTGKSKAKKAEENTEDTSKKKSVCCDMCSCNKETKLKTREQMQLESEGFAMSNGGSQTSDHLIKDLITPATNGVTNKKIKKLKNEAALPGSDSSSTISEYVCEACSGHVIRRVVKKNGKTGHKNGKNHSTDVVEETISNGSPNGSIDKTSGEVDDLVAETEQNNDVEKSSIESEQNPVENDVSNAATNEVQENAYRSASDGTVGRDESEICYKQADSNVGSANLGSFCKLLFKNKAEVISLYDNPETQAQQTSVYIPTTGGENGDTSPVRKSRKERCTREQKAKMNQEEINQEVNTYVAADERRRNNVSATQLQCFCNKCVCFDCISKLHSSINTNGASYTTPADNYTEAKPDVNVVRYTSEPNYVQPQQLSPQQQQQQQRQQGSILSGLKVKYSTARMSLVLSEPPLRPASDVSSVNEESTPQKQTKCKFCGCIDDSSSPRQNSIQQQTEPQIDDSSEPFNKSNGNTYNDLQSSNNKTEFVPYEMKKCCKYCGCSSDAHDKRSVQLPNEQSAQTENLALTKCLDENCSLCYDDSQKNHENTHNVENNDGASIRSENCYCQNSPTKSVATQVDDEIACSQDCNCRRDVHRKTPLNSQIVYTALTNQISPNIQQKIFEHDSNRRQRLEEAMKATGNSEKDEMKTGVLDNETVSKFKIISNDDNNLGICGEKDTKSISYVDFTCISEKYNNLLNNNRGETEAKKLMHDLSSSSSFSGLLSKSPFVKTDKDPVIVVNAMHVLRKKRQMKVRKQFLETSLSSSTSSSNSSSEENAATGIEKPVRNKSSKQNMKRKESVIVLPPAANTKQTMTDTWNRYPLMADDRCAIFIDNDMCMSSIFNSSLEKRKANERNFMKRQRKFAQARDAEKWQHHSNPRSSKRWHPVTIVDSIEPVEPVRTRNAKNQVCVVYSTDPWRFSDSFHLSAGGSDYDATNCKDKKKCRKTRGTNCGGSAKRYDPRFTSALQVEESDSTSDSENDLRTIKITAKQGKMKSKAVNTTRNISKNKKMDDIVGCSSNSLKRGKESHERIYAAASGGNRKGVRKKMVNILKPTKVSQSTKIKKSFASTRDRQKSTAQEMRDLFEDIDMQKEDKSKMGKCKFKNINRSFFANDSILYGINDYEKCDLKTIPCRSCFPENIPKGLFCNFPGREILTYNVHDDKPNDKTNKSLGRNICSQCSCVIEDSSDGNLNQEENVDQKVTIAKSEECCSRCCCTGDERPDRSNNVVTVDNTPDVHSTSTKIVQDKFDSTFSLSMCCSKCRCMNEGITIMDIPQKDESSKPHSGLQNDSMRCCTDHNDTRKIAQDKCSICGNANCRCTCDEGTATDPMNQPHILIEINNECKCAHSMPEEDFLNQKPGNSVCGTQICNCSLCAYENFALSRPPEPTVEEHHIESVCVCCSCSDLLTVADISVLTETRSSDPAHAEGTQTEICCVAEIVGQLLNNREMAEKSGQTDEVYNQCDCHTSYEQGVKEIIVEDNACGNMTAKTRKTNPINISLTIYDKGGTKCVITDDSNNQKQEFTIPTAEDDPCVREISVKARKDCSGSQHTSNLIDLRDLCSPSFCRDGPDTESLEIFCNEDEDGEKIEQIGCCSKCACAVQDQETSTDCIEDNIAVTDLNASEEPCFVNDQKGINIAVGSTITETQSQCCTKCACGNLIEATIDSSQDTEKKVGADLNLVSTTSSCCAKCACGNIIESKPPISLDDVEKPCRDTDVCERNNCPVANTACTSTETNVEDNIPNKQQFNGRMTGAGSIDNSATTSDIGKYQTIRSCLVKEPSMDSNESKRKKKKQTFGNVHTINTCLTDNYSMLPGLCLNYRELGEFPLTDFKTNFDVLKAKYSEDRDIRMSAHSSNDKSTKNCEILTNKKSPNGCTKMCAHGKKISSDHRAIENVEMRNEKNSVKSVQGKQLQKDFTYNSAPWRSLRSANVEFRDFCPMTTPKSTIPQNNRILNKEYVTQTPLVAPSENGIERTVIKDKICMHGKLLRQPSANKERSVLRDESPASSSLNSKYSIKCKPDVEKFIKSISANADCQAGVCQKDFIQQTYENQLMNVPNTNNILVQSIDMDKIYETEKISADADCQAGVLETADFIQQTEIIKLNDIGNVVSQRFDDAKGVQVEMNGALSYVCDYNANCMESRSKDYKSEIQKHMESPNARLYKTRDEPMFRGNHGQQNLKQYQYNAHRNENNRNFPNASILSNPLDNHRNKIMVDRPMLDAKFGGRNYRNSSILSQENGSEQNSLINELELEKTPPQPHYEESLNVKWAKSKCDEKCGMFANPARSPFVTGPSDCAFYKKLTRFAIEPPLPNVLVGSSRLYKRFAKDTSRYDRLRKTQKMRRKRRNYSTSVSSSTSTTDCSSEDFSSEY